MKLKKILKKIQKYIDNEYFISYFKENGIRIELIGSKRLTGEEREFNRNISNRIGAFKNTIKKNLKKLEAEKNEKIRKIIQSKNEYYIDKIEELRKNRVIIPSKIIKKKIKNH